MAGLARSRKPPDRQIAHKTGNTFQERLKNGGRFILQTLVLIFGSRMHSHPTRIPQPLRLEVIISPSEDWTPTYRPSIFTSGTAIDCARRYSTIDSHPINCIKTRWAAFNFDCSILQNLNSRRIGTASANCGFYRDFPQSRIESTFLSHEFHVETRKVF
jgi:hypothetical protein